MVQRRWSESVTVSALPCLHEGQEDVRCRIQRNWIHDTVFLRRDHALDSVADAAERMNCMAVRKSKEVVIQTRWNKIKADVRRCPNCKGHQQHLCVIPGKLFKRYWIECWRCHWCGSDRSTIWSAVKYWNSPEFRKKR